MCAPFALRAQQPPHPDHASSSAFTFRPILGPDMTVGGHTFTKTVIEGLTLSDTGDVAFLARWNEARRFGACQK
jgi:hypothetical protein